MAFFCNDTAFPLVCDWSWRLAVVFVIGFVIYKLIYPKKRVA